MKLDSEVTDDMRVAVFHNDEWKSEHETIFFAIAQNKGFTVYKVQNADGKMIAMKVLGVESAHNGQQVDSLEFVQMSTNDVLLASCSGFDQKVNLWNVGEIHE